MHLFSLYNLYIYILAIVTIWISLAYFYLTHTAATATLDGLDDFNTATGLTVSASNISANFLLDEYARELIGEWQRWQTLKRFRLLLERLALNPQIQNKKSEYYLRPVMQDEINLIENGDEYQTPGYWFIHRYFDFSFLTKGLRFFIAALLMCAPDISGRKIVRRFLWEKNKCVSLQCKTKK